MVSRNIKSVCVFDSIANVGKVIVHIKNSLARITYKMIMVVAIMIIA
jgi:hypothetical protein